MLKPKVPTHSQKPPNFTPFQKSGFDLRAIDHTGGGCYFPVQVLGVALFLTSLLSSERQDTDGPVVSKVGVELAAG